MGALIFAFESRVSMFFVSADYFFFFWLVRVLLFLPTKKKNSSSVFRCVFLTLFLSFTRFWGSATKNYERDDASQP